MQFYSKNLFIYWTQWSKCCSRINNIATQLTANQGAPFYSSSTFSVRIKIKRQAAQFHNGIRIRTSRWGAVLGFTQQGELLRAPRTRPAQNSAIRSQFSQANWCWSRRTMPPLFRVELNWRTYFESNTFDSTWNKQMTVAPTQIQEWASPFLFLTLSIVLQL